VVWQVGTDVAQPSASPGAPNHMVPCNMLLGAHSGGTEYSSHVGCDAVLLGVWSHSAITLWVRNE